MHMRKKKWARPELAVCPYYVDQKEIEAVRGHWRERFSRPERPLHVELGCGKGVSTAQLVHANRDINYLAVDISSDVLGDTRRNIAAAYGDEAPDNVLIVKGDIGYIRTFVAPEDSVSRLYINFCNPWPRIRHHKRRLTHPRQLLQYRDLLTEDGEIWFKTDDDGLFHDSLAYLAACGFETRYLTYDLHRDGFAPNYVSEHEQRFSAEGIPIKFGIFRRLPEVAPSEDLRRWLRQAEEPDEDTAEDAAPES